MGQVWTGETSPAHLYIPSRSLPMKQDCRGVAEAAPALRAPRESVLLHLCCAVADARADEAAAAPDSPELWSARAQLRAAELNLLRTLELHPVWPWLRRSNYLPHTTLALLLGRLEEAASRSASPRGFWTICGVAAQCGHPAYAYDTDAANACTEIAQLFATRQGGYRRFFRQRRAELRDAYPAWSGGKCYRTALREVGQLYLEHFWIVWREAAGLPPAGGFTGVAPTLPISACLLGGPVLSGTRAHP